MARWAGWKNDGPCAELLALAALSLLACCARARVRVGSKNFTEQLVLGEIVAQHLENRLHGHVSRKLDLGGTLLTQQAMVSGRHRRLSRIHRHGAHGGAEAEAAERSGAGARSGARGLSRNGISNGWTRWASKTLSPWRSARGCTASTTLSKPPQRAAWKLGAGYEFAHREDGLPGLDARPTVCVCGLVEDHGSRASLSGALERSGGNGGGQQHGRHAFGAARSRCLQDDQHYFPPYECALVVREEAERQFPALRPALMELSGRISSDTMRRLNYELDGKHRPAREIARDFPALRQALQ